MTPDEAQVREVVASWLQATKDGDAEAVLNLITDDIVFLLPGRPPMLREEFAAATRAQSGQGGPDIEGVSNIKEVQVAGDMAFLWQELSVTVTPPGKEPIVRAGHTLSIFRKVNGKWRLARDANLLAAVQKET